jgi:hypothetical protein
VASLWIHFGVDQLTAHGPSERWAVCCHALRLGALRW